MQASLKITLNNRFSIRLNANVMEMSKEDNAGIWMLKVEKNQLSAMMYKGNECEINSPGKETLQGQIQQVQSMDRDFLSVKALVFKTQNTVSH